VWWRVVGGRGIGEASDTDLRATLICTQIFEPGEAPDRASPQIVHATVQAPQAVHVYSARPREYRTKFKTVIYIRFTPSQT